MKSIYFAVSTTLLTAAFYGCSNARLSIDNPQKPLEAYSTSAKYCSKFGRTSNQPLKVVFVVDMSMSNIGKFVGANFDTTSATDLAESRFDVAEKFITDCGSQNPLNQYAVVGFSNGIISVPGSENCSTAFASNTTDAVNTIEALRKIQKDNVTYYSSNPQQAKDMTETDYTKAIDCTQTKISTDIQKNGNQQPFYQVFFMTDGKPNPDTCNGDAACYADKITLLGVQASAASTGLKFQPIFYGKSDDKADALKILSPMAEAGKVDQVQVFDDIKNASLCQLTAQPISVRYRKDSLFVINLTAKLNKGEVLADSDMDGIPDALEEQLGYDPTNRRTYGVLDSVCKSLGGPGTCKPLVQQLNCKNQNNNLSLSDCDIRALKLDNLTSVPFEMGIDSDNDGIPDIIEVLRDTLPNYDDASTDLDGDGLTNRTEIFRGSQPNVPDRDVSSDVLITATESLIPSAPGCAANQEAWQLDISHLPLVPVKAFTETALRPTSLSPDAKYLDISHKENENVILITFKSVPENDLKSKSEIWGAMLKINLNDQRSILLNPADFYLMGQVAQ